MHQDLCFIRAAIYVILVQKGQNSSGLCSLFVPQIITVMPIRDASECLLLNGESHTRRFSRNYAEITINLFKQVYTSLCFIMLFLHSFN